MKGELTFVITVLCWSRGGGRSQNGSSVIPEG